MYPPPGDLPPMPRTFAPPPPSTLFKVTIGTIAVLGSAMIIHGCQLSARARVESKPAAEATPTSMKVWDVRVCPERGECRDHTVSLADGHIDGETDRCVAVHENFSCHAVFRACGGTITVTERTQSEAGR